ncbi:glutaredoxin family protein [Thalassotalea atypica]|uniref:glutaredoxin family protein n=1 Tax=Thalassotalea atypica TaxID=2054316 RepID=UPI002572DFA6|nr:glutaredoxin family protein [Thalassotalea atypica]
MLNAFILYSSEGCHLCEDALALCHQVPSQILLTVVDIVEHNDLVEQYGQHIPVLQRDFDGKELFWPFDLATLCKFIEEK